MIFSKLQTIGFSGLLFCLPATAQTIGRFPPIVPNSLEDSACYFKTNQGSIVDLNSICGSSRTKEPDKQTPSSASNPQLITPSPILPNPEFRPIAGANPSNPFGRRDNNSNQCYIVDSEGNRCNPNP